jgi:hypothetical protein
LKPAVLIVLHAVNEEEIAVVVQVADVAAWNQPRIAARVSSGRFQ